jgi:large subunit ribosomal protein L24
MYGKSSKKKQDVPHGKSHVRKNDTVVVLSGKDRGKQGKVLRVIPGKGKAIVERVNFTKKHTKPNPQRNQSGGILEREAPIEIAKLQVICPSCGEATRIAGKEGADGVIRTCKKCSAEIGK